jgi:hypothetical protein
MGCSQIGLGFVNERCCDRSGDARRRIRTCRGLPAGRRPGLLFAASGELLDSLGGARRALRAAREEFARYGFHRVEDIAAIRQLDEAGTRALAEGGVNTDDHNCRRAYLATRRRRARRPIARALWEDHDWLRVPVEGWIAPS